MMCCEDFKVSIIIPVYNAEKTIAKCIKSIQNQTYKNLEIICVNDGSTDNSLQVLKDLSKKDSRIICVNQNNGGPFKARSSGIRKSNGEYIMFVDADDELLSMNAIKILIDYFMVNSDVQIVQFGARVYYKRFIHKDKIQHSGSITIDDLKKKYYYDYLGGSKNEYLTPALCNKIYKANIIKEIMNLEDVNLKMGEDLYLLLRILFYSKFTKMLNVDDVLYKYLNYLGGSRSFGFGILEEYSLLKKYQNEICNSFLNEDAKYHCNLESIYYMKVIIQKMIINRIKKEEIIYAISQCDLTDCVQYAKEYFRNLSGNNRLYDELKFLVSDYSPEEYYEYIINNLPKDSILIKIKRLVSKLCS